MNSQIKKIFKKIRKIVDKNTYEDLNNLLTQEKYSKLFSNVIMMQGNEVKNNVDILINETIEQTKEELKILFEQRLENNKLLDRFNKILKDQLIIIYWISIIFNQFNDFVFKSQESMTIQQYCLKSILDHSFSKYSKKLVNAIIDELFIKKSDNIHQNKFNKDLLKIINFFSYRTFLPHLNIEKNIDYNNIDVAFNCDFTESQAKSLIFKQELAIQQQNIYLVNSDDDESKNKNHKMDIENDSNDEDDDEEIEMDKKKSDKKKKNNNNIEKSNVFESLYGQIEKRYMERLMKQTQEYLKSIQSQKVSTQIKEIEEYIFREQQFGNYYLSRLEIKISDSLFDECVVKNYIHLINHQQYGFKYMIDNKQIEDISKLYQFIQNNVSCKNILSNAFTEQIENKIIEIDQEQEVLFKNYQSNQSDNKNNNAIDIEEQEDDEEEEQQNEDEDEGKKQKKKNKKKSMRNEDEDEQEIKETNEDDNETNENNNNVQEDELKFLKNCQDKWIQKINNLHEYIHEDILSTALENDTSLTAAFKRGFENQFHLSEVAVEYLVNISHQLLLNSSNNNYKNNKKQQLSYETLNGFIPLLKRLFSFISQKDSFLEQYQKKLCRRLLYGLSKSTEQEEQTLNTLEEVVGSIHQIKNMKTMLSDLKKNELLQSDYITEQQQLSQQQNNNSVLIIENKKDKINSANTLEKKNSNQKLNDRKSNRNNGKNNKKQNNSRSRSRSVSSSSWSSSSDEKNIPTKKSSIKQNKHKGKKQTTLTIQDDDSYFSEIEEEEKKHDDSDDEKEFILVDEGVDGQSSQNNHIIILESDAEQLDKKSSKDKSKNNNNNDKKKPKSNEKLDKEKQQSQQSSIWSSSQSQQSEKEVESQLSKPEITNENINIMILTDKKWPLRQSKQSAELKMPQYLELKYVEYADKYLSEFKQRKLQLLHHYSYATMTFKADKSKSSTAIETRNNKSSQLQQSVYTLQVSSYTMIILLRFNSSNKSIKFNDLLSSTQLKKKILQQKLNLLVKNKILLIENSNGQNNNNIEQQQYKVNKYYNNKKELIELDWIPYEEDYSQKLMNALRNNSGLSKMNEELSSEMTHYRKTILNCHIVRIMKQKEKLSQDELIKEVFIKLKNNKDLFMPSIHSIKEQIKHLVEKSLIQFSDLPEEKDIILYIK